MQKLYENDRETILRYIEKEPEYNLFIFGDIENFGVDSEDVEVFAYIIDKKYDSLILRYREYYIFYSQIDNYQISPVIEFIVKNNVQNLSGKGKALDCIIPLFNIANSKSTYLSKIESVHIIGSIPRGIQIKEFTEEDARDIVEFYTTIDEFSSDYIDHKEEQTETVQFGLRKGGRGLGAYYDGELIATVMTGAENSVSAMVIGVAVDPQFRQKGIASYLVSDLCQRCLNDGMRFLCLFYDNPKAGSIYRKVGFKEIGTYSIIKLGDRKDATE